GSVRIGGVLDVSGPDNSSSQNSPRAGNVSMVVGGDLLVSGSGQVLSKGWRNVVVGPNYNGGVGGSQSYVVSGGIEMVLGSVLSSVGGGADRSVGYSTTGGSGGNISLSAVNGVLLRGSIQSGGGSGYRGGSGGSLSVSSSGSYVDYSGVMSSVGGDAYTASGYPAGNGGTISISGFG
ncbi:hypothetical protein, partial [Aquirufa sp. TARAVU-A1A]